MDNLVRAFPPLAVPLAVAGSAGYVLGKLRHKEQRHRHHHAADHLAAEAAALGPETEPLLEAALLPVVPTGPLSPPEPLANTIVDENLPVTVSRLWQIVMQPDLGFAMQFHETRRNRDVVIGKWHTGAGRPARKVSFVMPLKKNALGPKEAECFEEYSCLVFQTNGFHVEVTALTPKVPCGGSFQNRVQWCAIADSTGGCRLRISCQVDFVKPIFGIKGIISKSSLEGTRENYVAYLLALREHIATMPAADAIPAIHSLREIGGPHAAAGVAEGSAVGARRPLFAMRWWEVLLVIVVLAAWVGLGYLVYSQNQRLGLCQSELRALRKNLSPVARC